MLPLKKYLVPAFFAAALCFSHLNQGTLAVDAVRYAKIAANILERGDWFHLYDSFTATAYANKPPFVFWLLAFLFKHFGFSTAIAKLPSAFFAFCSLLLIFQIAAKRSGEAAGYLALMFLGLNLTFMRDLVDLNFDAMATFGALLCLQTTLKQLDEREKVSAANWFWFSLGTFMILQSKPPYVMFVYFPILVAVWRAGLLRTLFSSPQLWLGAALPLGLEIAWLAQNGAEYFATAADNQVTEQFFLRNGFLANLAAWAKAFFVSWAPVTLIAPFVLQPNVKEKLLEKERPDHVLLDFWLLPVVAIIFFINCRPRYIVVPMLSLILLTSGKLAARLDARRLQLLQRGLVFCSCLAFVLFSVFHLRVHRDNGVVSVLANRPELISPEVSLCVDKELEYRSARYARETRFLASLELGREVDVFYAANLPDSRKAHGEKLLADNGCLEQNNMPNFAVLEEFRGAKLVQFN